METTRVKNVVVPETTDVAATGLCVSCNHVENCALRVRQTTNVHWCEEFDAFKPAATNVSEADVRKLAAGLAGNPVVAAAPYAGLCSNCEGGASCTLPRAAAPVHFCEEYR